MEGPPQKEGPSPLMTPYDPLIDPKEQADGDREGNSASLERRSRPLAWQEVSMNETKGRL